MTGPRRTWWGLSYVRLRRSIIEHLRNMKCFLKGVFLLIMFSLIYLIFFYFSGELW